MFSVFYELWRSLSLLIIMKFDLISQKLFTRLNSYYNVIMNLNLCILSVQLRKLGEFSNTHNLSKFSNPGAIIITKLNLTTKDYKEIFNHLTKWNIDMMNNRDCQVFSYLGLVITTKKSFLRVFLMEYITKKHFTM